MFSRRRVPLSELQAERIALIKPSALGDVVHAMPVLGALRTKFPKAHLSWIVNKAYLPLLEGHVNLDETIPFDRSSLKKGWRQATGGFYQFTRELKRRQFDLVIDLQGLARSGIMTWFTGAPRRVGMATSREGARFAYTDVIPVPDADSIHAIDRYWKVAEALGVGDLPKRFDLPVAEAARQWAQDQLRDCPRPWMAFGVGSRWLTKRWLPEHYTELARRAQSFCGGTVFFIGTPDEAFLSQQVSAELHGPWKDFTGTTTLHQLIGLLSIADVMVANDTGPLHVAVALGRPCVAPYTCTQVRRHGPYLQLGAVETSVWCHGSYLRTCDRLDCMKELVPDKLWPHLAQIISPWASTSRSA